MSYLKIVVDSQLQQHNTSRHVTRWVSDQIAAGRAADDVLREAVVEAVEWQVTTADSTWMLELIDQQLQARDEGTLVEADTGWFGQIQDHWNPHLVADALQQLLHDPGVDTDDVSTEVQRALTSYTDGTCDPTQQALVGQPD